MCQYIMNNIELLKLAQYVFTITCMLISDVYYWKYNRLIFSWYCGNYFNVQVQLQNNLFWILPSQTYFHRLNSMYLPYPQHYFYHNYSINFSDHHYHSFFHFFVYYHSYTNVLVFPEYMILNPLSISLAFSPFYFIISCTQKIFSSFKTFANSLLLFINVPAFHVPISLCTYPTYTGVNLFQNIFKINNITV